MELAEALGRPERQRTSLLAEVHHVKKLILTGAGLVILGGLITFVGQLHLFAAMDAADAVGRTGTLFAPGTVGGFAGIVLLLAGAVLLIVGAIKTLRRA